MRILLLGCNHRTANVSLRERLAFGPRERTSALADFKQSWPHAEAVLLSTCNRSELYVARPLHQLPRVGELIQFLGRFSHTPTHEFVSCLYHYEDSDALRHLFRVVSSLDSLVVGESQIINQAKDALDAALQAGTAGKVFQNAFQTALSCAKQIRGQTGIGAGKVSVGSVAVDYARRIFSRLDDKTVLMIGAGEMGQLALQHLLQFKPARTVIVNRTRSRAQEAAEPIGAQVGDFQRLADCIVAADIVISCTGSPEPLLSAADFATIPARRRYKPLVIVDIAVPRDFDPAIGQARNVYLCDMDNLHEAVEQTIEDRRQQIRMSEAIIDRTLGQLLDRQGPQQDLGPTIHALEQKLRDLGHQELAWLLPKLTGQKQRDAELIRQFQHRLLAKIMYHPSRSLTQQAADGSLGLYARVLREVFDLHDGAP
jgi:glutamyl-tRNA reductase